MARSAHSSTRSHPGLRRTARLTALAVGAAVVSSAIALPAFAAPTVTLAQAEARPKPKVHLVARGESLSSIAKTERVSSWKRIYDANPFITYPDVILPGQRLVIPDAEAKLTPRALPSGGGAVSSGKGQAVAWSSSHGKRTRSSARRASRGGGAVSGGVWDRLAACESGGNWGINTGNGFSGGLQFSPGTWRANGGSGSAHNASRAAQIRVAQRVRASQGWGAWPACSRRLGLR